MVHLTDKDGTSFIAMIWTNKIYARGLAGGKVFAVFGSFLSGKEWPKRMKAMAKLSGYGVRSLR